MSAATHKYIFLVACLCFAVILAAAFALADGDRAMHMAYYVQYQDANAQFDEQYFEESYEVYRRLAAVYEDSYVLHLKMAVCAMNLEMWEEAVEHSRRTIELYPMLAKDEPLMEALAYSLEKMGDPEAAAMINDYFYGVTRGQT